MVSLRLHQGSDVARSAIIYYGRRSIELMTEPGRSARDTLSTTELLIALLSQFNQIGRVRFMFCQM